MLDFRIFASPANSSANNTLSYRLVYKFSNDMRKYLTFLQKDCNEYLSVSNQRSEISQMENEAEIHVPENISGRVMIEEK